MSLSDRRGLVATEPPAARSITATMTHYGWTRTRVFQRLAAGDQDAAKAGRRTTITTISAQRLFESLPRGGTAHRVRGHDG